VFGETTDEVLEYVYAADDPDSVYYFHTDKLGSIMLAVDGSGTIQESYRYTEFGQTTVVDSDFNHTTRALSEIHNSKRYTARDRIIGDAFGDNWYHYRARTYRPDAGRFVQRDPLQYVDGSSLYIYVNNGPLNSVDPTGLCSNFSPTLPINGSQSRCVLLCEKAKSDYMASLASKPECSGAVSTYSNCLSLFCASLPPDLALECGINCMDTASGTPQGLACMACYGSASGFNCSDECSKSLDVSVQPK
jgi:RHS repeat-associated protein